MASPNGVQQLRARNSSRFASRFDAILPGFSTLVRNRRVTNEKDGDFTLAELVSCEVYLKVSFTVPGTPAR
jgi:hypothetical protein